MKYPNGNCRKLKLIAVSMIMMLTAAAVISLFASGEGAEIETREKPVRNGDMRFLEGSLWIPDTYEEDRMWVVVYLENQDKTSVKALNNDDLYNGREIANSFSFPIDGLQHDSGDVRRPLVELFTATNCVYCPGPEGAMHRLIESGVFPNNFSLIEWHLRNDPYTNNAAEGRATSYGVSGTPATVFEGGLVYIGGDSSNQNTEIDRAFEEIIDLTRSYRPLSSFAGGGSVVVNATGGFDVSFNVSMTLINALPKGNWTLTAAVCEDMNKLTDDYHNLRMVERRVFSTGRLYDLQEGFPEITINDAATFPDDPVMGDVSITWNADDPQDGTDLSINIILKELFGPYEYLVEDEVNDGEYIWNTTSPRVPDGNYQLIIEAIDKDDNAISVISRSFTLDNMDYPDGEMVYPAIGDSVNGRAEIRWDSSDDEDELNSLWVRISISNDTGQNWKVITYNAAKDDFIVNDGTFDFNTANYEDIGTYMLMIELMDTDGMLTIFFSDVFEIYNNDQPQVWIMSPGINEEISGTLDIGWKVFDQEDLPSSITGNFSLRKESSKEWQTLFLGPLDDTMENKTFDTSELPGDGGYTLRFTATDSRGRSISTERVFKLYDPDAPVFDSVSGPPDTVKGSFSITWESSDEDSGEALTFNLYLREETLTEWILIEDGITEMSYTFDGQGLNQTMWMIKIEAVDSSYLHLTVETVFGPFYLEIDEAPIITPVVPAPGFNGSLGSRNISHTSALSPITLSWMSSDPDGDGITYSIHYRLSSSTDWFPIATDVLEESVVWDFSALPEGEYLLRIIAMDDSEADMRSEVLIGPFMILVPIVEEDDGPDDDLPPLDNDVDDELIDRIMGGIRAVIIGGVIVFLVLIILIVLIIMLLSRGRKKKALPDENIDLSVPEFERIAPQRPMPIIPQETPAVQGGPLQPDAAPVAEVQTGSPPPPTDMGKVSWDD